MLVVFIFKRNSSKIWNIFYLFLMMHDLFPAVVSGVWNRLQKVLAMHAYCNALSCLFFHDIYTEFQLIPMIKKNTWKYMQADMLTLKFWLQFSLFSGIHHAVCVRFCLCYTNWIGILWWLLLKRCSNVKSDIQKLMMRLLSGNVQV